MRDTPFDPCARPFGVFVHHQGRGHALRCAALVDALPETRPVSIFCARPEIVPPLRDGVEIVRIPSLFETPPGAPHALALAPTPETLHCAPLGWATIREATARMARWFAEADPALMIVDVSAEIAQLARICSVPHVKIIQHGDRSDPGHRAAYDGAVGLLAPFHRDLAQPDWSRSTLAKTRFAPGLGLEAASAAPPTRADARRALGLREEDRLAVALTGAGGDGASAAPIAVAARTFPGMRWVLLGEVRRDWHATPPGNLSILGWVEDARRYVAAADLVVSSAGNTTCHEVMAAGAPWIVIPEWRYFDEQTEKAKALARASAAIHLPYPPTSAHQWRAAVAAAEAGVDISRQKAMAGDARAAEKAARWLEGLAARIWSPLDGTAPAPLEASEEEPRPCA